MTKSLPKCIRDWLKSLTQIATVSVGRVLGASFIKAGTDGPQAWVRRWYCDSTISSWLPKWETFRLKFNRSCLRALQEREFDRLGSFHTRRVIFAS